MGGRRHVRKREASRTPPHVPSPLLGASTPPKRMYCITHIYHTYYETPQTVPHPIPPFRSEDYTLSKVEKPEKNRRESRRSLQRPRFSRGFETVLCVCGTNPFTCRDGLRSCPPFHYSPALCCNPTFRRKAASQHRLPTL